MLNLNCPLCENIISSLQTGDTDIFNDKISAIATFGCRQCRKYNCLYVSWGKTPKIYEDELILIMDEYIFRIIQKYFNPAGHPWNTTIITTFNKKFIKINKYSFAYELILFDYNNLDTCKLLRKINQEDFLKKIKIIQTFH